MERMYVGTPDLPFGKKLTKSDLFGEVVCCEDCKHADSKTWHCNHHCVGIFDGRQDIVYRITIHPTFFCSEGVRS